jgi:dUTP pyrophosphatase
MDVKTMFLEKIRGFEPISEQGLSLIPNMIELFKKKGFKKIYINKEYTEPQRSTYESAGSDIFYTGDETITINPTEKAIIITNVKAYMQNNEMLMGDVRSSQGLFSDLMLCNTIAIIDKDYYNNANNEGNIAIGLRNIGYAPVIIKKNDAIAQLMFVPYLPPDNPPKSQTRDGGTGSTTK